MPPPLGLANLSARDLIDRAGGDPWQLNDELQTGDAGAINAQADAFHAAAGSATEAEDDFKKAKERFEKGWRHNGAEHPITESAEVTYATETLRLQKSQLGKIAVQLETVATSLATAQRSCDAEIAVLDNGLHELDDAIGAAESADQDAQELRDGAVAMVGVTLGDIQATRDGYAATMAAAQASIETVQTAGNAGADGGAGGLGSTGEHATHGTEGDGGAGGLGLPGTGVPGPAPSGATGTGPPGKKPFDWRPEKGDVIVGSAGAITSGTADGVGKAVEKVLADSPKTGPLAPSPSLTKFLENPTIRGVELKGFSRLGRLAGAVGAVPAVFSDHAGGNSWSEAVTRETVGTGAGMFLGAVVGDAAAGALAGSVVPGVGTAAGVVVGAVVGMGAALGGSKIVEAAWEPAANAVGSAIHGVKSAFGFG